MKKNLKMIASSEYFTRNNKTYKNGCNNTQASITRLKLVVDFANWQNYHFELI